MGEDAEPDAEGLTYQVCYDAESTEYVDEEDPDIAFTFACATEGSAVKLIASAAAALAVTMM